MENYKVSITNVNTMSDDSHDSNDFYQNDVNISGIYKNDVNISAIYKNDVNISGIIK